MQGLWQTMAARAFVIFLIAGLLLPTSQVAMGAQLTDEEAIDQFAAYADGMVTLLDEVWGEVWRETFGAGYTSPDLDFYGFDASADTGCGLLAPGIWTTYYCIPDATIYVDAESFVEAAADYGLIAVDVSLAHAWSWHVLTLLEYAGDETDYMLTADCMSGWWIWMTEEIDLAEPGAKEAALWFLYDASGGDSRRPAAFEVGYANLADCLSSV